MSITVWAPDVITLLLFPEPSTNASAGRVKVPGPSATLASTARTPVKVLPGTVPARAIEVEVPSLSRKSKGVGTVITDVDVLSVIVTDPGPVGDGSPRLTLADNEPPDSTAPISHAAPVIGKLSEYDGRP